MVKIRLKRGGAKRRPFYRVIAIDERAKRDGRALEFLGTYDPVAEPPRIDLDTEKIDAWRRKGAQLSKAVGGLMRRSRRGQAVSAGEQAGPPSAKPPAPAAAAAPAAPAASEPAAPEAPAAEAPAEENPSS